MFSLFCDQSFGGGVFALFQDSAVVEVLHREIKDSSHPCALFEQLLDRHKVHLDDITCLACGVGPGSYTGIRSAAATMKGIAFATQKPIVAIPSLLLFAPVESGTYCIAADGGIGGVFVQEISIEEEKCHVVCPEALEREAFLTRASSGVKIVVKSRDWLMRKGLDPSLAYREVSPHVNIVARVVIQDFNAGRYYTASTLPLLYLRKTQAEIDRQVLISPSTQG